MITINKGVPHYFLSADLDLTASKYTAVLRNPATKNAIEATNTVYNNAVRFEFSDAQTKTLTGGKYDLEIYETATKLRMYYKDGYATSRETSLS